MQMKLCSRCKKRVAVIYVTKTENGQTTSEGLCLRCAKELGIKPMNDIIRKLGISEEEFDAMADEVAGMIPFAERETSPPAASPGPPRPRWISTPLWVAAGCPSSGRPSPSVALRETASPSASTSANSVWT